MAKLLFFWDYDTQWGADRSRAPGGVKDWGHLEFENTEHLLELHAQYDVPACFAVVGAAALPGERPYHDPDQIRRIHAAGHEIASHTFRHEWLPGLNQQALYETLRSSKEALEQCIGAPVVTFVPPYNQPFDYSQGWSFSLSERREAGSDRTDLRRLCNALRETGYRFCRVAYRPMHQRMFERLAGRRIDRPTPIEFISGITCVRINTPGGFGKQTRLFLQSHLESDGLLVCYGHPHSITKRDQEQSIENLEKLLSLINHLKQRGKLCLTLPRELIHR